MRPQPLESLSLQLMRLAWTYVLGGPALRLLQTRRRIPLCRRPAMVVPHLRYGALSGAQDREKADPGMITRGPLTVSLHRRSRRREVVAAGTFLDRSQPPDN